MRCLSRNCDKDSYYFVSDLIHITVLGTPLKLFISCLSRVNILSLH